MLHETISLERPHADAKTGLTAGQPPLYRSEPGSNVIQLQPVPSPVMRGVVRLVLAWSGLTLGLRSRWVRVGPSGNRVLPPAGPARVVNFDALRLSGEPHLRRCDAPSPR